MLKSNGLLKILLPFLVIVVLVIVIRGCNSDDAPDTATSGDSGAPDASLTLTDDEIQALGIEGDTPRDTVATLVGEMRAMRKELDDTRTESQQLREQNKQLTERAGNVDSAIQSALREERRREAEKDQSLLKTFEDKIDTLRHYTDRGTGQGNDEELPVGLGLGDGGLRSGSPGMAGTGTPGLVWINPADARTDEKTGESVFPSAFSFSDTATGGAKALGRAADSVESRIKGKVDPNTVRPVYTIPQNSTLTGSVAMTALLGRVPINGTVSDPYPFRVIVGKDNLTANGIEIPEVRGAILAGTTTGDWTLSCVRGKVDSITFVFDDGTVRTVPTPDDPDDGNSSSKKNGIGTLSTPHGLPCIPGERKTNAREFLLTTFLMAGAEGAADGIAMGETSTQMDTNGAFTALTGNADKFILGRSASEGLSETRKWVQERFGQTFDAVYVPPGQPVSVLIDVPLPIDYETEGRKVHYAQSSWSQPSLD
ncbi:TIGR03752 family integrating conjugative element protein [Alloalcanivorax xenomutans]|uniref:TIGR03752 family integrating conjugative element protein n=1 Tax=Alloalcanivorax xenomutans TaxID=1094342 RepID=UPI00292EBBFC|nr:TIGR03752 family integrating conjugative element protein [Alloalcanivorax xenomutans]WOA33460.1 TIGR03752 family integrating conjugative element protein [Alloalcanivorax xenomutans]